MKYSMLKIVFPSFLLMAAAPASSPIAAGLWEVSNDIQETVIDGARQTDFPVAKPKPICMSSAEASRGPGLAFSDPERCQVLESNIGDGTFNYKLRCKATLTDGTIMTTVSGTFTSEAYSGEATSKQRQGGMNILMRSRMKAKRTGDC